MAKKTFDNPDSHEREYTRLLLRYSKQLCTNINKVLIPHIGDLKSGFDADARVDGWLDNLQSLMANLMHMATTSEGIVINRLHGLFAQLVNSTTASLDLLLEQIQVSLHQRLFQVHRGRPCWESLCSGASRF